MNEIFISKSNIVELLKTTGKKQKKLLERANNIRQEFLKNEVYFRGLIEISNICVNDCYYCGIRKSNTNIPRYSMTEDEILESVKFCNKANYGSIVLQSGERQDDTFIVFVENIIKKIKHDYPNIGITLCIGEQSKETYKKLFDAGAHRYLLRIETSNRNLYQKLHPNSMQFEKRLNCLKHLKEIGYQVGTGVMINSPYQTIQDLANDLLFFQEIDIDMVGMGPFLTHPETLFANFPTNSEDSLNISLNMIAILRLLMPDINIAATTALQAINPKGRERGLLAGANIIMPLVTPKKYRKHYMLYDDKPCIDESSSECMSCITNRIISCNMLPIFGNFGDSLHFYRRIKNGNHN